MSGKRRPIALSPNEAILRGLAAMARALNAADAWTPAARQGYSAASHAVPLLGVVVDVSPARRRRPRPQAHTSQGAR